MSEEITPEAEPEATPEAPAEAAPPAESVTVTEDATAEQRAEAVQLAVLATQYEAVAQPATPVVQQTPSNEAPAEEPVEVAPQNTIEEAAAKLLAIVDEGHKLGDRTLDAARDELRAILGA